MSRLQITNLILIIYIQTSTSATLDKTIQPSGEIWLEQNGNDLHPTQATSYGTITLGEVMSIEFDFDFHGRSNDPPDRAGYQENFFRIGYDPCCTSGCNGEGSSYPAMFLARSTIGDILDIKVSDGSSCGAANYLTDYGALSISQTHHIKISFNNALVVVYITGGGKHPYNRTWERTETPVDYLGNELNVYLLSGTFYSTPYNRGDATFNNIIIKSSMFTFEPTPTPTSHPITSSPTQLPSISPTKNPTQQSSVNPTVSPTNNATLNPSIYPTVIPTNNPTIYPTVIPTNIPTLYPTTGNPTDNPTVFPTTYPTVYPTTYPSLIPTIYPTLYPTTYPTVYPTTYPTIYPTNNPSTPNTLSPTEIPTSNPINNPSVSPSLIPSKITEIPTVNSFEPPLKLHFSPTKTPLTDQQINELTTESPSDFGDSNSNEQSIFSWATTNLFIICISCGVFVVFCCICCGIIILCKKRKSEQEATEISCADLHKHNLQIDTQTTLSNYKNNRINNLTDLQQPLTPEGTIKINGPMKYLSAAQKKELHVTPMQVIELPHLPVEEKKNNNEMNNYLSEAQRKEIVLSRRQTPPGLKPDEFVVDTGSHISDMDVINEFETAGYIAAASPPVYDEAPELPLSPKTNGNVDNSIYDTPVENQMTIGIIEESSSDNVEKQHVVENNGDDNLDVEDEYEYEYYYEDEFDNQETIQ